MLNNKRPIDEMASVKINVSLILINFYLLDTGSNKAEQSRPSLQKA